MALTTDVDEAMQKIEDLRDASFNLHKYLMGHEMTLMEQMEDLLKEVEMQYNQLCTVTIEFSQQQYPFT